MMRLWVNSYARTSPVASSAMLSVIVHTILVTAWVIGTLPATGLPADTIANRPIFLPPPDRTPAQQGSKAAVHYVDLARPGPGTGDGPRMMGDARPTVDDRTLGNQAKDSATATPVAPEPAPDSVYSILEVDTAVVRTANSSAPAYPLNLLTARITGFVQAQYVVDTTGFADTTSFHVISSTNAEFITAVREALPYMRFEPAKIGKLKVRQLVQQQFSFHITDTVTAIPTAPTRTKKP